MRIFSYSDVEEILLQVASIIEAFPELFLKFMVSSCDQQYWNFPLGSEATHTGKNYLR